MSTRSLYVSSVLFTLIKIPANYKSNALRRIMYMVFPQKHTEKLLEKLQYGFYLSLNMFKMHDYPVNIAVLTYLKIDSLYVITVCYNRSIGHASHVE